MRAKQRKKKHVSWIDWTLLLIIVVLTIFGLIMQYSASSYDLDLVIKQGGFAVFGIFVILLMPAIPVGFYRKLSPVLFFGALAATMLARFIGKSANGATRWIKVGPITFQPSELLKAAMILTLAVVITKYINEINNLPETTIVNFLKNTEGISLIERLRMRKGYLLIFLIIAISAIMVAYFSKDLGTAVIIFGIGFAILFVISPRIKYLLGIVAAGVAAIAALVIAFPYRMGRITAWLNLEANTSDLGYQIKQGLYAIGSGGLLGKGLGKSIQKDVIPEAHTDMIFSVVCEELGILGGIVLIVLFILLILRLKKIYDQMNDLFSKVIIIGVATHMALQAFVNMAVMTNLIPNTGVPLPFISYGVTSLLCLMMEIGFVMVVRHDELKKEANRMEETGKK